MLTVAPLIGFIPVRDLAVARRFYEGTLGLIITAETPQALVVEPGGGTMVRITLVGQFQAQPFTIAGWAVPDIERTLRHLLSKGIYTMRFQEMEQDDLGVWAAPGGDRVAWFQDPDHNVLSITQFVSAGAEDVAKWSAGWSAPPPPGPPPADDGF